MNFKANAVATIMREPNEINLPPLSLHEEVATRIQWAAGVVQDELSRLAKGAGLSLPQYRVLRILRDAGEPLSCSEIAERMIARDPDITRLVDKLEKAGLVSRTRSDQDRRVVRSAITDKGRGMVTPLDARMERLHTELLGGLDDRQLRELSQRLGSLRRRR